MDDILVIVCSTLKGSLSMKGWSSNKRDKPPAVRRVHYLKGWSTIHWWRDHPPIKAWSNNEEVVNYGGNGPLLKVWSTIQRMIHKSMKALIHQWGDALCTTEGMIHCTGHDNLLHREWSGPLRRWSSDPPMRCEPKNTEDDLRYGTTYMFLRWGYCYGTLVRLYGVNSFRNTPCHALFCCFRDI